ncbi:MAG: tetratricopeptide repeat protein [Chitinophagaceae bacterium]|nr:tetratricopeptide repeat protein [Chitinophagaceae bacterium]
MKSILILFCFIVSMLTGFAQKPNVDSILLKIAVEKDEDKKVDLLVSMVSTEINNDPEWGIETGLKLLNQSKRGNNNIELSVAYSFLGQGYRLLGNNIKALDYHHKAIAAAEKSGNLSILALQKIKQHIFTGTGRNTIKQLAFTCQQQHMRIKGKMRKLKVGHL